MGTCTVRSGFSRSCVSTCDFFCRPAADSNLMPSSFPRASLNRYTPKFSGEAQKLTWCQQFGIQIFPKKVMPIFVAVFSVLLDLISSPGQTVDLRLQHVIHIWKAYASVVNLSYLETILLHPTRRQSFAGKLHSTLRNI